MEAQAAAWIAAFSYPAVFLLLVACGLGAPLSEDLILVTGGLVAGHGHALLAGMMAAGWVGTVCGDFLLYRVGRTLGGRLLVHPRLQRLLPAPRVAWVRAHLARRGALTVFAVRFLPGFRVPTYLLAGAGGLPARRFLLADALGAAVSAPLLVFLGYRFGRDVLGQVQRGFRWVVLAAVLAATLLLLRQALRRWRRLAAGGGPTGG
jgi:membrane protein DedA with SNARE-associated domain